MRLYAHLERDGEGELSVVCLVSGKKVSSICRLVKMLRDPAHRLTTYLRDFPAPGLPRAKCCDAHAAARPRADAPQRPAAGNVRHSGEN